MDEELQSAVWKIVWPCRGAAPVIKDFHDNAIATIAEASDEKMSGRAQIVAAAPDLYETIVAALQVFRVIAEYGEGQSVDAAQDMIPVLESALDHANFPDPISADLLVG